MRRKVQFSFSQFRVVNFLFDCVLGIWKLTTIAVTKGATVALKESQFHPRGSTYCPPLKSTNRTTSFVFVRDKIKN